MNIHAHKKFAYDLRQRINPAYAAQRGTESYERRECAESIEELVSEIERLKADADRYQWLRKNAGRLSFSNDLTAMLLKDKTELDGAMKDKS